MFVEKHPDVNIAFKDMEENHTVASLMAGEGDNDILHVTRYNIDKYKRHDILAPLDAYEGIADGLDQWVDISGISSGGCDGVPIFLSTSTFFVNDELTTVSLEMLNYPYTWAEFLAAGDRLFEQNRLPLLTDGKRFPIFVSQYMGVVHGRSD